MHKKKHTNRTLKIAQIAALGILSVVGSFALGIETAGEVHPFARTQAEGTQGPVMQGDVDADGQLTINDAIRVLEFSEGLDTPTVEEIRHGDTDGDLRLTGKDALKILRTVAIR